LGLLLLLYFFYLVFHCFYCALDRQCTYNWKLKKKYCRTSLNEPSTVGQLQLSQKDIDAMTLNNFKSRLERRNHQMDFFKEYSASLQITLQYFCHKILLTYFPQ